MLRYNYVSTLSLSAVRHDLPSLSNTTTQLLCISCILTYIDRFTITFHFAVFRTTMQLAWLFCVLFLFAQAQDSPSVSAEWNGDPKICTVDSSTSPTSPSLPKFPNKAEFMLEHIEYRILSNVSSLADRSVYEYIYDY